MIPAGGHAISCYDNTPINWTGIELDYIVLLINKSMLILSQFYTISLITGWTVYTEKYKARGLYEGPRGIIFFVYKVQPVIITIY